MRVDIIYNEDCIGSQGMCILPDKSIDMILCDLPYGTTAIACVKSNRKYIGFDTSKKYCRIARERLLAEKTLWDIKSE